MRPKRSFPYRTQSPSVCGSELSARPNACNQYDFNQRKVWAKQKSHRLYKIAPILIANEVETTTGVLWASKGEVVIRQGATLLLGMAPTDAAGLDWGNAAACARKPVIQEVTFPLHQQDKLPVFVVERLNLVKILNGGERRFWLIRPWKQPMTAE